MNEPDAAWFDAGLPVVGYFHDREVALEGVEWMTRWLDAWQEVGTRRLLDFRELAAIVGRSLHLSQLLNNGENDFLLTVETDEYAPLLVRPLTIFLRVPDGQIPERVLHKKLEIYLDVQSNNKLGWVKLPCVLKEVGRNI